MAMIVLTGPIIRAGTSLSEKLVVASGGIYRIVMPQAWNGAVITFQLSYDGNEFYDVCDRGGAEISMRCIPMSVIPIGEYLFYVHSVKIRSGTQREPVIQDADRTFKIVLETKTAYERLAPDTQPV